MAERRVLAVAHRGDPYRFRENTLASVESALAAGADLVEVDVQLTRDGVPVLLHDLTLDRLWRDRRPVGSVTAEQLTDVGSPGLRVPTLAEALKAVGETPGARLMIDLDTPGPVAATWQLVTDLGAEQRVAFCGPIGAMLAVRELAPAAELALTWKQPRLPGPALLADLRPRYVNPPFGLVTAEFTAAAHGLGLEVSCWTVDRRRTMARMLEYGVDSLTTNRIALLHRVLGAPSGTRRP
ncbi:glycerophosphodiester phosphodiesterase [Kitasatospora sp. NPDC002227]|uniref:glycerophosphodiester phosphodiesterase n=1 Tax=Kitasatospora sp. NPDC002227 TaxID=3154773 RepID=UPI003319AEED